MHPGSRAAYGSSQGQAGVRSMGILPIRELVRILRATLTGWSVLPSPRLTGPEIKSKGKGRFASARRTRALWLFPGPHGIAAAAVDKARRVRARDRAHSAAAQGCAVSGTRPL